MITITDDTIEAALEEQRAGETPNQRKSRELAARVQEEMGRLRAKTLANRDLELWLRATFEYNLSRKNPNRFEWVYNMEGYEHFSFEDFISGFENDEDSKKHFKKEADFVRGMYGHLSVVEEREGFVRVAFKRFRTNDDNSWGYRAVAIFPEGSVLYLDPEHRDCAVTEENPGVIYLVAQQPCVNHACDIVYKEIRDEGKGSHIPYISPENIHEAMGSPTESRVEFMDPKTRETKDKETYVMACLLGYFDVESYRIPKELLI